MDHCRKCNEVLSDMGIIYHSYDGPFGTLPGHYRRWVCPVRVDNSTLREHTEYWQPVREDED